MSPYFVDRFFRDSYTWGKWFCRALQWWKYVFDKLKESDFVEHLGPTVVVQCSSAVMCRPDLFYPVTRGERWLQGDEVKQAIICKPELEKKYVGLCWFLARHQRCDIFFVYFLFFFNCKKIFRIYDLNCCGRHGANMLNLVGLEKEHWPPWLNTRQTILPTVMLDCICRFSHWIWITN